jgi:hypothetical protein
MKNLDVRLRWNHYLGEGYIDFENYEEAEKYAEENNGETYSFKIRDGHNYLEPMYRAWNEFDVDEYLRLIRGEYYQFDDYSIREDNDNEENTEANHLLELFQNLKENEALIVDSDGSYFDTIKTSMMDFHFDAHSYHIGVFVKKENIN